MREIIKIDEVCQATKRSRSTVHRYLAMPEIGFPTPVHLGPRDRGWYKDEIAEWIAARPRRQQIQPR